MIKQVTHETWVSVAREVVEEKGDDYVYEIPPFILSTGETVDGDMCRYVHGDEPGCIVGHMLVKLGVPLEAMEKVEGKSVWEALQILGYDLDATSTAFLDTLQNHQDRGYSWGAVFQYAIGKIF